MKDNVFEITNLKMTYGKRVVLNVKKLNIQKGRIISLIGPSGAGKSTLMSILGGIEVPTTGEIVFEGQPYPVGGKLELATRRRIAMVFQKPVMFNKSVYENIAYGLKLRKTPKDVIASQVQEIAEKISLGHMLRQNARKLSGGEMQRVALARAIVLRPDVLLMDEATTNLDPANVAAIEELVRYANACHGTTVIMATHNLNQAKRLSGRCIFLLNGELVEEDDTNIMLEHAQNSITRAFISGEMVC